jgi:hypothetical protein
MRKITDCCGRRAREEVYSEVAIIQTRKSLAHSGYNAVQKFIGMRMRKMADHCFLLQKSGPDVVRSGFVIPAVFMAILLRKWRSGPELAFGETTI